MEFFSCESGDEASRRLDDCLERRRKEGEQARQINKALRERRESEHAAPADMPADWAPPRTWSYLIVLIRGAGWALGSGGERRQLIEGNGVFWPVGEDFEWGTNPGQRSYVRTFAGLPSLESFLPASDQ